MGFSKEMGGNPKYRNHGEAQRKRPKSARGLKIRKIGGTRAKNNSNLLNGQGPNITRKVQNP